MKRFIAIMLVFASLFSIVSCSKSGDNEDSDTMIKGDFFVMFIEKMNIYPITYTENDLIEGDTYAVAAQTMLDWQLLSEDKALKNLDSPVTKEVVAYSCVNCIYFKSTGNKEDFKDADLCEDSQAAADAIATGIVKTSNKYFDAKKAMTVTECEAAIDAALAADSDGHFKDEGSIKSELQDNVIAFSSEDIKEGDIEFPKEAEKTIVDVGYKNEKAAISTMEFTGKNAQPINTVENGNQVKSPDSVTEITEFGISNDLYQRHFNAFAPGKIFIYDSFLSKLARNSDVYLPEGKYESFCGEIVSVQRDLNRWKVTIKPTEMEKVFKSVEDKAVHYKLSFPKLSKKLEMIEGYSVEYESSNSGGISAKITKRFTNNGKWSNPSANPSVSFELGITELSVDMNGIGDVIFGKSKSSKDTYFKINFSQYTEMTAESGGLRYTPANNGNGKFLTNMKKSRWTGAQAGGSKMIKIGKIPVPIGHGFSISVGLYLIVQLDGTVSMRMECDSVAQLSFGKNGMPKIGIGSKTRSKPSISANLYAALHGALCLNLFKWNIIDAAIEAGVDVNAMAMLFAGEEKSKGFATKIELEDEAKKDEKLKYCMDSNADFVVKGLLITPNCKVSKILNFTGLEKEFYRKKLFHEHMEDGQIIPACTRGTNKEDGKTDVNDDNIIELSSYKVHLDIGGEEIVYISSLPVSKKDLKKVGGLKIKSKDTAIAKVRLDKSTNAIVVTAIGAGSTEIEIKIKKSKKSKEYYTQQLSVTVKDPNINYDIMSGDNYNKDVIVA